MLSATCFTPSCWAIFPASTTTAVQIAKAPGAIRKPKHWRIEQPVDLLEVGTKEIRLRRGLVLKHFRVRDVICRWDVM